MKQFTVFEPDEAGVREDSYEVWIILAWSQTVPQGPSVVSRVYAESPLPRDYSPAVRRAEVMCEALNAAEPCPEDSPCSRCGGTTGLAAPCAAWVLCEACEVLAEAEGVPWDCRGAWARGRYVPADSPSV